MTKSGSVIHVASSITFKAKARRFSERKFPFFTDIMKAELVGQYCYQVIWIVHYCVATDLFKLCFFYTVLHVHYNLTCSILTSEFLFLHFNL